MDSTATHAEIFSYLYISGHLVAESEHLMRQLGITCVINVRTTKLQLQLDDVEYMNVEVDDVEFEPIHWYFDDTTAKIEEHRLKDGKVLVSCERGISRSATICLMYMVRYAKMTLRDAYHVLQNLRSVIRPNPYFWKSMIEYEKKHHPNGLSTVKLMRTVWKTVVPDLYTEESQKHLRQPR